MIGGARTLVVAVAAFLAHRHPHDAAEGVAASMAPGGRYHLQLVGGSQVYGPVRGAGTVRFTDVRLELPTTAG